MKWNTNTAAIIDRPEHTFIENTIASMRAAFADGADIVEFDVRLTRDGKLAVFHDDTLEYRTDGKGFVRDHVMDESQTANISACGNDPALDLLRENFPEMKLLSMKRLKRALLSYELIGWTGIVPGPVRNMELPAGYTGVVWTNRVDIVAPLLKD